MFLNCNVSDSNHKIFGIWLQYIKEEGKSMRRI